MSKKQLILLVSNFYYKSVLKKKMNNMRPPRKRNADWDYKKTTADDINPDEDFQIYLLAKPDDLKKYFIEDVPYFWCHHKISKDREFQKYLNQLNNQIQVKGFPYVDNMLQVLDQFTGNFKIICQIKDFERIIEYHNNNKKLICIHIFDLDLKKSPNMVRNKKIQIKSDDFKLFKRTLYRKNYDKNEVQTFTNATRITNWDIAEVNQSRLVLKTLLVSKNDEKGKDDFVKLATIIEQQHGKVAEYQKTCKINSTPQEAIKWYTKQGFYHRLVNNTLKAGKGNPLFLSYIRFPVKQLYNSIKTLYKTKELHKESFECYRGGRINEIELEYFKKNKKGFIQMQGFLSCSKNKAQMSEFIVNCVFKIVVTNLQRETQWDHGFCFLDSKELTQFIKEEEVLFNIFSVMQIKDVTKEVFKNQQIDVITLEYGSLASFLYQKKHNLTLKDPKFSELCIKNYQALKPYYDSITNQVDCFRFFNKFKQVEKYCIAELQFLEKHKIKDKNKQFQAYLNMANNYLSLKQFIEAKEYFLKAKQLADCKEKHVLADELTLSKIQNGLGIANKNLNKPVQAKNNYLKTINLIQKSRNRNGKIFLATAYNNLAAILVEEGQERDALDYYEKALNLLEGEENQTVANIHYNIGLYNLKKPLAKQAIKNFIRSLQIYNKIFGTHRQTINCNVRLGQAYLRDGSSKQVYERYFSAALDMMKNLAFSQRDQYVEVKREIEDIKEKHRKNVQRHASHSVNSYQISDIFSIMKKKDEVDRYMDQQKKERDKFHSDHQVFSHPIKKYASQKKPQPYFERQSTPSIESTPQINKSTQQKMRQMRAQNILGDDNPFSFTKNIPTASLELKPNDLQKNPSSFGEYGPSKIQNRQGINYNDIIDSKLAIFNRNPSSLHQNKPSTVLNTPSTDPTELGLNNSNSVNGNFPLYKNLDTRNKDQFYNEVFKDITQGRKKRTLIF